MANARILVIGAGVNGSVCAAGLHNAGIDVTVLARGKHFEEVRDEGIVIEDPFKNKRSVTKVPVINRLDPNDVYDLTTHAALVAPLGKLIIKHGCDTSDLGRSTADLRLLVDALRETLAVLRSTGFKIIPPAAKIIKVIPRFVLVAAMRVLFSTKFAEVGAAWHCSQAPDEMRQLAMELQALVDRAGLPVPALRKVLGQD